MKELCCGSGSLADGSSLSLLGQVHAPLPTHIYSLSLLGHEATNPRAVAPELSHLDPNSAARVLQPSPTPTPR